MYSPRQHWSSTVCNGPIDWLSMVLRLHQHNIGYMADGFYRSDDPTNSIKALKEICNGPHDDININTTRPTVADHMISKRDEKPLFKLSKYSNLCDCDHNTSTLRIDVEIDGQTTCRINVALCVASRGKNWSDSAIKHLKHFEELLWYNTEVFQHSDRQTDRPTELLYQDLGISLCIAS